MSERPPQMDRMDQILESMAVGDSPIELRMQVDNQAHDEMLRDIRNEALKRLEGRKLKRVLEFIDRCGGKR